MPIRPGRFKFAAEGDKVVINGTSAALYRIFNSSDGDTLELTVSGQAVTPGGSIDVATDGSISVHGSGAGAKGIYVSLELDSQVRSGHLKIPSAQMATKYLVVNPDNGPKESNTYRFYNSGGAAFKVWRHNTEIVTLQPDDSVDIEVQNKSNNEIRVQSLANDVELEGIYEYLGKTSS